MLPEPSGCESQGHRPVTALLALTPLSVLPQGARAEHACSQAGGSSFWIKGLRL